MEAIVLWIIEIAVIIVLGAITIKLVYSGFQKSIELLTELAYQMTGYHSDKIGKIISGVLIGTIITWFLSAGDESGKTQRAVGLITLGIFIFIGLVWQWYLIVQDKEKWEDQQIPFRVLASAIICSLLVLGVITRGIFLIHYDDHVVYRYGLLWRDIVNVLTFSLIFMLKSYFAAFITMVGLALTLHFFLEYNTFSYVAALEPVLDQVIALAPSNIQDVYVVSFGVYAAGVSFKDTYSSIIS